MLNYTCLGQTRCVRMKLTAWMRFLLLSHRSCAGKFGSTEFWILEKREQCSFTSKIQPFLRFEEQYSSQRSILEPSNPTNGSFEPLTPELRILGFQEASDMLFLDQLLQEGILAHMYVPIFFQIRSVLEQKIGGKVSFFFAYFLTKKK